MKVLFIEPPKDVWFVMGDYLPPPLSILQLAAFIEDRSPDIKIQVIDCQVEHLIWKDLERRIEDADADIIAPNALATCNTYVVARTVELAKKVNPEVLTVVGGQHFTSTAEESLIKYPEIDVIVRGEGEETLFELIKVREKELSLSEVDGISFRYDNQIIHNQQRPFIERLDELPFPGYHFVEDFIDKYHFLMMAGRDVGYALIEGSRGCTHNCSFCSQVLHWRRTCRTKSVKRIVDEMEYCYNDLGIRFIWLTDDNFGLGIRAEQICEEIINRGLKGKIMWFIQTRSDEILKHEKLIPKLRRAGLCWALVGVERHDKQTLSNFQKSISPDVSNKAIEILKKNNIFAQAMFILGARNDSHKSIEELRKYANDLDPDLSIFGILTPFPGTETYKTAKKNGWIEDDNWAHYDMLHAIMPTENLTRQEIQEELYTCYREFYGSWRRRLSDIFSQNHFTRRTYRYLVSQNLLSQLRSLI